MYKSYFGLKANPFNVTPDPRFLALTNHTREALSCLVYGIQKRRGFVVLTGEVGTGKTTLIKVLLEWLRRQGVATAYVFNPRLDVVDFLEFIMSDFGIPYASREKGHMLTRLNHWLLERYRAGQSAVLVVDEAQNLSSELLEEIRLLTNLETSTDKLLQIVLSGQQELEQRIREPQLRQLRQRITMRCHTYPLSLDETATYINQRLKVAGWSGSEIFGHDAVAAVHRFSQGVPRVINLLCEHSLVTAYALQKRPITAEIVADVASDFELDILGPVVPEGVLDELDQLGRFSKEPTMGLSVGNVSASAAEKGNL